jgi:ferredoxin
VREDGYLYLLTDTPQESHRDAVYEAQRSCPTQAITIDE